MVPRPMSARIRPDLLHLAWPAALTALVQQLYRPNDMLFVRELGAEVQAAIGVGSMVSIIFMGFGQMVGIGTLALSTRRLGEGNTAAAHATMRRGLRAGLLVGAALAVAVPLLLPWLCGLMVPGDTPANLAERQHLHEYLFWISLGQVVMVAVPVVDQSFFAMKDSRRPLVLQALAVGSNAGLNALLVGPFGVAGIAWATVISRFLALALGVWWLARRGVAPPWRDSSAGASIRRIVQIGTPACISISIYALVYVAMIMLSFPGFGAEARSVLGIGFGIETQFYCLYWGLASAQASLVGRYLGEGRRDKALAVSRLASRWAFAVGCGTVLCFYLFGRQLIGILSTNPQVQAANWEYLALMAIAQPFQALHETWVNALIGAGRTAPVMLSTSVTNLLRIPLAHLLGVVWGYGMPGIWWAINISTFLKATWSYLLYHGRRWLEHEV